MTTDDETLRRYREASAVLDERPARDARASILAAAAREIGARPRAADAPRALRMRWPLAAAATVMLSTLAVMLASRTEQEIGTFTAPTDASPTTTTAPPEATPATPSPSATPAPEPSAAPASPKVTAPTAPMQRPAETRAAPPEVGRQDERQRAAPRNDVPAARDVERAAPAASAPPTPPTPAAPATPAAPMREAPAMQRGISAESAKPSAAPTDARREAADAAGSEVEMSAAQWLERIVQLRTAGRHHEADLELKRFSERYPEVEVPKAARAPTATR